MDYRSEVTTPEAAMIEPADYTATLPRKRMGAGVLFTDEELGLTRPVGNCWS